MILVKLILNNCYIFVWKLQYPLEVLLKFAKNKKNVKKEIMKRLFELYMNENFIISINIKLLPDVMERRYYSY